MTRLSSAALLVAACIALSTSTHTAHAVYTVEECNRYFQCPAPFAFSLGVRGECQCCPQGGGACAFPEALCFDRPANCAQCGPGGECSRCNMGYQLSGSTCIANACNVDLCSLCDANSRCIQCKKGYTLQGSTCVRSAYTLDECEGLYACPQGNKLMNGFGNCYCCDENELCNFAEAKCPQHPEHCAVCKLGSTSECIGCKPGYYLEEDANKCAPPMPRQELPRVRGELVLPVQEVRCWILGGEPEQAVSPPVLPVRLRQVPRWLLGRVRGVPVRVQASPRPEQCVPVPWLMLS